MHFKEVKAILSANNGMNIYRGCTHGCIYCDSRSKCYNMEHDFEDIEVKINAPELLENALRKKRKKCMIGTGAMCDPYMHIEVELGYTRRCLEIIDRYEFGLYIQTKSDRILRDLDLLKSINNKSKCVVQMTLTTYNENLCKIIEPAVCSTKERYEVLKIMRDNGIPTVVWIDPILPFINDTEENLRGILNYCIEAEVLGIICFEMGLTLRDGNREYFYKNLDRHFSGRMASSKSPIYDQPGCMASSKSLIYDQPGCMASSKSLIYDQPGRMASSLKQIYQKKYGLSYELKSDNSEKLWEVFHNICEKHGIVHNNEKIFNYLNTYEENPQLEQMTLF